MSVRIVHLVDPVAGEDALLACREALATPGFDHRVWLIGTRHSADLALSLGIAPEAVLTPPTRRPLLAWRAARSLAGALRETDAAPDLVHCWSFSTLSLARAVFGLRLPKVVYAPHGPQGVPGWRRVQLSDGPLVVTTRRDHWREWIADVSLDARLLSPPLSSPASVADRAALRSRLGLGADDPTLVIALLTDPPAAADARAFAFMLGLLHLAGARVMGVTPRGAGQLRRAARFVRAHGRRWGLIEWSGPMSTLAPAADLAMWCPPTGAGLVAASFARLGVPTVVPAGEGAELLARSGGEVLEALGPSVPQLAAALLPTVERLTASPRTPAPAGNDPGSVQAFRTVLADVWAEAARRWSPVAAGALAR